MKILYAIQGTGNGHVARAREIVPILQKHYDVFYLFRKRYFSFLKYFFGDEVGHAIYNDCLLYTSPSPRDIKHITMKNPGFLIIRQVKYNLINYAERAHF